MLHPALLLLICGLSGATSAAAQSYTSALEDGLQRFDEADAVGTAAGAQSGQFIAIPLPILNPTLGAGLAPTLLYTFSASANDEAPRSTIGGAAGYTSTDSWFAGGGGQFHLAGGRYRLGLVGAYGSFNLDFYGVGDDPVFSDDPVEFSAIGAFAKADAAARIAPDLFAGVSLRYIGAEISVDLPIPVLPRLTVPFDMIGVGPSLEYDAREHPWWPRSGVWAKATLLRYDEALGSDTSFSSLEAGVSHYVSLRDDLVLATNLRAAATDEEAPFFMLPFVTIRGFPAGEILDHTVVEGQAELRWKAWRRFGAVAFVGAGMVADGFASLGSGERAAAGGAGLRYLVSEVDRINAGLDVATDGEELTVYFRIGEAF